MSCAMPKKMPTTARQIAKRTAFLPALQSVEKRT